MNTQTVGAQHCCAPTNTMSNQPDLILYTRLTSAEVRRQLIELKGYQDEELPTGEVIRQPLNQLGYILNAEKPGFFKKPGF